MKKPPLVLVVDDSRENRFLLDRILTKQGFATAMADSGPKGREEAARLLPDIILLDIMMPEETGFATCEKLKVDPLTTDIPVIFISALEDVDSKVRGLSIGAVDYVTKPFEPAEVLTRIRLHLKLAAAYRAIIDEQAKRLSLVGDTQRAILVDPADLPRAGFSVHYQALQEAGGDFYDVLETAEGLHAYFVADIAGHDVGASFVTSALKALFHQNAGPMYAPTETIKIINSVLRSIIPEGMYATAAFAQLNRKQMRLSVVCAGHPAPLLVPGNGEPRFVESVGDVLGGFSRSLYQGVEVDVAAGDRVFLHTDGLVELPGKSRRQGREDLLAAGVQTAGLPLDRAVEEMVDRILGPEPASHDDVLLMGIEV